MPRATALLREKVVDEMLYDNHSPKGHHRHVEGIEQKYAFTDVDQLLADFMADVRRITGNNRGSRR